MAKFNMTQLKDIKLLATPLTGKPISAFDILSSYFPEAENIPSQTSNSGKLLTTNGSALSWASVDSLLNTWYDASTGNDLAAYDGSVDSLIIFNDDSGDLENVAVDDLLMAWISAFGDYADDTAAQAGGVEVGGLYWDTDGSLHKRLS